MLEHGGQLQQAAEHFRIPFADWLDLSTGINADGWPVPPIPAHCWQRLPEDDDGLIQAAASYYGNPAILAVAGSQAAIQTLPTLRPPCRVALPTPAYAEHAANWQKAGHQIHPVPSQQIDAVLPETDVLIIINPNNPTGETFSRNRLLEWHRQLQKRGGWLIIDEAFIDCQPEHSLSTEPSREGLIILRSIGKFFGLAGIRCGFVIAKPALLSQLQNQLGPWSISHPARHVAQLALQDRAWQRCTRRRLRQQSQQLNDLLSQYDLTPTGGTDLFQWVKTQKAERLYQHLAKQGILIRVFNSPESVRFGLPVIPEQWQRLDISLSNFV